MTGGRMAIGVACMPGYLHQYMTYSRPDLRFCLCQAKPQIVNVPRCLRPSSNDRCTPSHVTVRMVQAAESLDRECRSQSEIQCCCQKCVCEDCVCESCFYCPYTDTQKMAHKQSCMDRFLTNRQEIVSQWPTVLDRLDIPTQ